jgi:hypothetical protein
LVEIFRESSLAGITSFGRELKRKNLAKMSSVFVPYLEL